MEFITELVSNVGFPIAMCLLMAIENRSIRKDHKAETDAFVNAIERNTETLIAMNARLEVFTKGDVE